MLLGTRGLFFLLIIPGTNWFVWIDATPSDLLLCLPFFLLHIINYDFTFHRLSKELLLDPQQTLVFKVWHKAGKVCRAVLRRVVFCIHFLG